MQGEAIQAIVTSTAFALSNIYDLLDLIHLNIYCRTGAVIYLNLLIVQYIFQ